MTLVYARIADRTVADGYFAAADKVDQLHTTHLTTSPAQGPKRCAIANFSAVITRAELWCVRVPLWLCLYRSPRQ